MTLIYFNQMIELLYLIVEINFNNKNGFITKLGSLCTYTEYSSGRKHNAACKTCKQRYDDFNEYLKNKEFDKYIRVRYPNMNSERRIAIDFNKETDINIEHELEFITLCKLYNI